MPIAKAFNPIGRFERIRSDRIHSITLTQIALAQIT